MVGNNLSRQPQKPKFSAIISSPSVQNAIANTLTEKGRIMRFTANLTTAVTNNPTLAQCDPMSIISAGLLGESLNLSPSPQLGQYYLVPYGNKAQFQLGYKGYIQLATRSGQYRRINVLPIKEGELKRFDPLNEEIEVNLIEDESRREETPTIGYFAMFEYLNGFKKCIYWSRQKMEFHAKKYSKAYSSKYSFWTKDFDAMACKTMLRQLIGKWGVMSTEFERAYTGDMAVFGDIGANPEYVDVPEPFEQSAQTETSPTPENPLEIPQNPEIPDDGVIAGQQSLFDEILEGRL